MQEELTPILKQLAEKYNRPVHEIEDIVKAPFYLVYKVMDSGDRKNGVYYNIRVRGLGIFRVCDRVVQRLDKIRKAMGDKYEEGLDRKKFLAKKKEKHDVYIKDKLKKAQIKDKEGKSNAQ